MFSAIVVVMVTALSRLRTGIPSDPAATKITGTLYYGFEIHTYLMLYVTIVLKNCFVQTAPSLELNSIMFKMVF